MLTMKTIVPSKKSGMCLVLLTFISLGAGPFLNAAAFNVELWPDGVLHYRYCQDDPECDSGLDFTGEEFIRGDKKRVRDMMDVWETALTITDPLTNRQSKYIRFERCTDNCPESHLLVRYNLDTEENNMCTYFEGNVEKVGGTRTGKPCFT